MGTTAGSPGAGAGLGAVSGAAPATGRLRLGDARDLPMDLRGRATDHQHDPLRRGGIRPLCRQHIIIGKIKKHGRRRQQLQCLTKIKPAAILCPAAQERHIAFGLKLLGQGLKDAQQAFRGAQFARAPPLAATAFEGLFFHCTQRRRAHRQCIDPRLRHLQRRLRGPRRTGKGNHRPRRAGPADQHHKRNHCRAQA